MSDPASPPEAAPPRFAFHIDRSLAVPVGVQLRGQIEYGVACGEIPRGAQLPSVRELSQELGLAHVTVAGVYRELGQRGLLTTQPGRGTYVADGPGPPERDLAALHRVAARLLTEAGRLGFSPEEVTQVLAAGLNRPRPPARPLHLAFVGIFPEATRFYADELRSQLPPGDRIEALTVQDLHRDVVAARVARSDLVVTLAHREAQVRGLLPDGPPVTSVQFIPADFTRTALAALSPLTRLGLVVTFEDFLPTMRAGVSRFAPHIDHVQAVTLGSPDLPDLLRASDVIVYATGSERVLAGLPGGTQAFEYRHVPDPRAVEARLLPLIEERRLRLAARAQERIPHAD